MATIIARNGCGLHEAMQDAALVSEQLLHCAGLPRADAEYRYSQSLRLPMIVLAAVRLLVRERERFDLILAGGLFDYLDDRTATFLVRMSTGSLLRRGGTMFFTNIAAGNPYRTWMDYVASWRLIHRSEDDIRALVSDTAAGDHTAATLRRDVSGLAILATVAAPV